jgi:hypothetical protein
MTRVSLRALLIALSILLLAACNSSDAPGNAAAAQTPEDTIRQIADLLKQGDIGAVMRVSTPPAEYERMKAEWAEQKKNKAITDEDRRKFAETMEKLTAPDAEQTLWAEFEPKLAEYDVAEQQKKPMLLGMGRGWLQGMVAQSETLSDAEKQQAKAAIDAFANWAETTRFTDPERVRQVIAIACRVARETGLKTLDEAHAMDFDQTMRMAQTVFLGFKEALSVYDFSLDASLDSVKPEVVSQAGDKDLVRSSYALLGTPLAFETGMERFDGRWYGEKVLEDMRKHAAETAADSGATQSSTAPAPATD